MSNGQIITSNGTFTYDQSLGGYYGDPGQKPWQINTPNTGPFGPFQQPNIQPQPYNPPDPSEFLKNLQNAQPVGATGDFCDFFDADIIKQLDKIMECDRIYIRSNAPKASAPMPKGSLKVQVHEYPHDWDNSITIYESDGSSIDDVRHVNGLVALLSMLITMSGRDVVLNEKDYMPGDDY